MNRTMKLEHLVAIHLSREEKRFSENVFTRHRAQGLSTVTEWKVAHQAKTSDFIIDKEIESVWSQCFLYLLEDTDGWRLSADRLSFSYCFDIFQALTWTNYYYPNFTAGDRQITWHAQDHMSSLCQSRETAPGSLSCEAVALGTASSRLQTPHPDWLCLCLFYAYKWYVFWTNERNKKVTPPIYMSNPLNAVALCTLEESVINTSNYPLLQRLLGITG